MFPPVDGNSTQTSPATPRKALPGLSGSGLHTPPRTPNAEQLTRNTSEPGAPSTPSKLSERQAGLGERPSADRGHGRAVSAAPAMRTPEVPGSELRRTLRAGSGLVEGSRGHTERCLRGGPCQRRAYPVFTGRVDNEEYRKQQRVVHEKKVTRRVQETWTIGRGEDEVSRKSYSGRYASTGPVPLFRRPLFASTLAGGSPHPQPWGDTNHDPGGSNVANRLYPASSALCAREKLCIRQRSPSALRAIEACLAGRRRTSAGSASNGLALSCTGVKLMGAECRGWLCSSLNPNPTVTTSASGTTASTHSSKLSTGMPYFATVCYLQPAKERRQVVQGGSGKRGRHDGNYMGGGHGMVRHAYLLWTTRRVIPVR